MGSAPKKSVLTDIFSGGQYRKSLEAIETLEKTAQEQRDAIYNRANPMAKDAAGRYAGLQTDDELKKDKTGILPPLPPDATDKKLEEVRAAERKRAQSRNGRASSFLTGAGGTIEARKSFLGGGPVLTNIEKATK